MAQIASKNLTIGRGQVFMAPYATTSPLQSDTAGLVYRDVGNAPNFSLNVSSETQEHYSSRGGVQELDDRTAIRTNRGGGLTIEDMAVENLAIFFFGSVDVLTQGSPVANTTEDIESVVLDRHYQLGVDPVTRPNGYRSVSIDSVAPLPSGSAFTVNTDYVVDGPRGFLYLPATSSITPGSDIRVTFDVAAHTRKVVLSGNTEKAFAIQYHAYNPKGPNQDLYLPFARVRPAGDLQMITEQGAYQQAQFEIEALPLGNLAAVYLNGEPVNS